LWVDQLWQPSSLMTPRVDAARLDEREQLLAP
jgi:hypothetical protein